MSLQCILLKYLLEFIYTHFLTLSIFRFRKNNTYIWIKEDLEPRSNEQRTTSTPWTAPQKYLTVPSSLDENQGTYYTWRILNVNENNKKSCTLHVLTGVGKYFSFARSDRKTDWSRCNARAFCSNYVCETVYFVKTAIC